MRSSRPLLALFPLLFLLVAAAFPTPKGFVNDFAAVLDQASRHRLEERLAVYERETTNEIAIAIFPSFGGRTIENVAVTLFEEWKIGKRANNNGILIVAAIQDRRVRIEVGYGLEGKVTDAEAGRIIRDVIAPHFRQGRYVEGLEGAVDALVHLIGGPSAGAAPPKPRGGGSESPRDLILLLLGVTAVLAAAHWLSRPRCPRCRTVMKLVDDQRVRTPTGFSRSLAYACPRCGYKDHRLVPIGAGAPGWGTGMFWGTVGRVAVGGAFGGFGGGSSGGGGASGGW